MTSELNETSTDVIADAARAVVEQVPVARPAKLKSAVALPPAVLAPPSPTAASTSLVAALPEPAMPATPPTKNEEMTMSSTTNEMMSFGQANYEAIVKSGQILSTGLQDLTRTMAESAQAQFDHTVATWKALSGTKSVKEALEIQTSRGRAALEKAVADTGRLTDASMKLAEQTFAPITARLGAATEKFGRAV